MNEFYKYLENNGVKDIKKLTGFVQNFLQDPAIFFDLTGAERNKADFIINRMRDAGILLGTDGPFENVIKIRPPMPFDKSNAELLVANMDRVLKEDFLQ